MKSNKLYINSVLYMFYNVVNGSIPFFLLPIMTHYLSPADYGLVSLFQTTLLFFVPLVGLSMGFNIDRLFFRISKKELSITIGNMVLVLIATLVIFTLSIFAISLYSDLKFIGLPMKWLYITPLIASFATINSFNLILMRNSDSVVEFGFWQVGLTVLDLSLSILFVVALLYGWQGRVLGIAIASVVIGIGSLYNIYRHGYLTFKYSKAEVINILKLCLPLLLQGIGTFIIFKANVYFINAFVDQASVGIYSVAAAFAAIMGIFQDAIAKTINPWFYKNLNTFTVDMKRRVFLMNWGINILLFVGAFGIYLISKILIPIMVDEKFYSAISLVLLLSLGSAFNGMYKLSTVYFIHLSRTKLLSLLTALTAILSVTLNYFLIINFGLYGASYGMVISLLVQFLLTLFFAQKIHPLPIKESILFLVSNIKSRIYNR